MSGNYNKPIAQTKNGQTSMMVCQFIAAFVPAEKPQPNITQLWSLKASEAIGVLIDFRSVVHRWQAQGRVDDTEFVAEVQRLEDAGLSPWLDELIALATCSIFGGEL
jgi:hypothetical protein